MTANISMFISVRWTINIKGLKLTYPKFISSFNCLTFKKDGDSSAVSKGVFSVSAVNTDSPAQCSGYIILGDKYNPTSDIKQGSRSYIKAWRILPLSSGKNTMSSVHFSHSLPFAAKSSGEEALRTLHHFLIYPSWHQSPLWVTGGFPPPSACLSVQAGCSIQGTKYFTEDPWNPSGLAEVPISLWGQTLWCVCSTNLNSRNGLPCTRPGDI